MNINGIATQYQNYAVSRTSSTKSSESTFDSFQTEIVNWGKLIKAAIEKEQENDSNGSIQMSEKKWRKLMKKVDNEINTKEQEQEEKKQLEEKNLIRKDTVAVSFQTYTANIQFYDAKLVQTSGYNGFLPRSGKRDKEQNGDLAVL